MRSCKYGRDDLGNRLTKGQRNRLDAYEDRLKRREDLKMSKARRQRLQEQEKENRKDSPPTYPPLTGRTRPQRLIPTPTDKTKPTRREQHQQAMKRLQKIEQREKKLERKHDARARSLTYQTREPRNRSRQLYSPNDKKLRQWATDLHAWDSTNDDATWIK